MRSEPLTGAEGTLEAVGYQGGPYVLKACEQAAGQRHRLIIEGGAVVTRVEEAGSNGEKLLEAALSRDDSARHRKLGGTRASTWVQLCMYSCEDGDPDDHNLEEGCVDQAD